MKALARASFRLSRRRRGWTLVEVLISFAIVGVLIAIGVPAVLTMRESSRRTECLSRQRQIGLAMHAHHDVHGKFVEVRLQVPCADHLMTSAFTKWLPFLERQAMFDALRPCAIRGGMNHDGPLSAGGDPSMPILRCPSDDADGGTNFRLCVGSTIATFPELVDGETPDPNGVFPVEIGSISAERIKDGLSTTIGMSEKLTSYGENEESPFDRSRSIWNSRTSIFDDAALLDLCERPPTQPVSFDTSSGLFWTLAKSEATNYNHAAPPNWRGVDCWGDSEYYGTLRATSNHPGGVNALYMDGHAAFAPDGIDPTIWKAVATRAGGESLAPPH